MSVNDLQNKCNSNKNLRYETTPNSEKYPLSDLRVLMQQKSKYLSKTALQACQQYLTTTVTQDLKQPRDENQDGERVVANKISVFVNLQEYSTTIT